MRGRPRSIRRRAARFAADYGEARPACPARNPAGFRARPTAEISRLRETADSVDPVNALASLTPD